MVLLPPMFMDAEEFLSLVLDMLQHQEEDLTVKELIRVVDRLYMEEVTLDELGLL